MYTSYRDIIDAIDREPIWYDQHRVPRYQPFSPDMATVYADELALVLVRCQVCQREFLISHSARQGYVAGDVTPSQLLLSDRIVARNLHLGDPPNLPCCDTGPFSSVVELRVLEYWRREKHAWVRRCEYELDVESEHMWDDGRFEGGFGPINAGWAAFETYRSSELARGDRRIDDPRQTNLEIPIKVGGSGFERCGGYEASVWEYRFWVDLYRGKLGVVLVASRHLDPPEDRWQLPDNHAEITTESWTTEGRRYWLFSRLPHSEVSPLLAEVQGHDT